jgi:curved DNA-binding protein CbpA
MDINYFKGINNLQDLKNKYRELAKRYHPDHGGDTEIMKQINNEFDYLFNTLPKTKQEQASKQTSNDFMQVIKNIIFIPNIKIELCGTWIWITGDTKPVKEQLKAAGFKFAGKKVAWYWHGEKKYRKRSKKKLSLEEIRDLYGSEEIQKKQRTAISA